MGKSLKICYKKRGRGNEGQSYSSHIIVLDFCMSGRGSSKSKVVPNQPVDSSSGSERGSLSPPMYPNSLPVPAPHHPQYTGPPKRGRPKNPPRPAAPPTPRQIRPAPDMASYPGSPALTPPPALPVPPRTPTPAINITPVSRVASRDASRAPSPPPFFHGPTNLPPQPYQGSSLMPTGPQGPSGIPRGELGRLRGIEHRMARLENAIDRYVDRRGEEALRRSTLPGLDESDSMESDTYRSSPPRRR